MTNEDLVFATIEQLEQQYGQGVDPSNLPRAHRTVLFVSAALGTVTNGGIQELLASEFPGDPTFRLMRQAFEVIQAKKASAALAKAFAAFQRAVVPPTPDERVEAYRSQWTLMDEIRNKESPLNLFVNAKEETIRSLAQYIRKNQASFESLGS